MKYVFAFFFYLIDFCNFLFFFFRFTEMPAYDSVWLRITPRRIGKSRPTQYNRTCDNNNEWVTTTVQQVSPRQYNVSYLFARVSESRVSDNLRASPLTSVRIIIPKR